MCGRIESDCEPVTRRARHDDRPLGHERRRRIGHQYRRRHRALRAGRDDRASRRPPELRTRRQSLWCSAPVCDIHDDDDDREIRMMATLFFATASAARSRAPSCGDAGAWLAISIRNRVYTGRWGAIPMGSVMARGGGQRGCMSSCRANECEE